MLKLVCQHRADVGARDAPADADAEEAGAGHGRHQLGSRQGDLWRRGELDVDDDIGARQAVQQVADDARAARDVIDDRAHLDGGGADPRHRRIGRCRVGAAGERQDEDE